MRLRTIALRGLITLVNTIDGPRRHRLHNGHRCRYYIVLYFDMVTRLVLCHHYILTKGAMPTNDAVRHDMGEMPDLRAFAWRWRRDQ